jgi:aclacinomycin oxidase
MIGGGYGIESRQLGSIVDYIYGVEVVVVDAAGQVRPVVATRDATDARRDLWWVHTGGGGGNFGVVTRVLLRSPDAAGSDPTRLLPAAAPTYLSRNFSWRPGQLTEAAFTTVLRNFGTWHERNSGPGSPGTALCPVLTATGISTVAGQTQSAPAISVAAIAVHPERPDTESLLHQFGGALTSGIADRPDVVDQPLPLVARSTVTGQDLTGEQGRFKVKAAYHRTGFTGPQLHAIYRHLNTTPNVQSGTQLVLHSYGGKVNMVAPDVTALAQRDSVFKAIYETGWLNAADDDPAPTAARQFYRDVYATTGGVPTSNQQTDGSYINYPDIDLADPTQNTSAVPWSTLYYKSNYARLQQIKHQWDRGNRFTHTLAIQ